jgi:hypothetical protein
MPTAITFTLGTDGSAEKPAADNDTIEQAFVPALDKESVV